MNFQINKDTLLNNLITAQKALSNKTPNPALQGIKLEVLKDHLVITTSNSDIAIKLNIKEFGEFMYIIWRIYLHNMEDLCT